MGRFHILDEATGSGGGGGASSGPRASDLIAKATVSVEPIFSANPADLAAVAHSNSYQNILSGLSTRTHVNVGGFVIETASSRDTVTIAKTGHYTVASNIAGSALASSLGGARSTLTARFVRERGGVDAVLAPRGVPSYSRNQLGAYVEQLGTHIDAVEKFEAGDKIRVQILFQAQITATTTFALSGDESLLSIVGEDAPTVSVSVAGLVGSLLDVSGKDVEEPTVDDKGSVYVDTYKHDISFPVRRFYASTPATGTGTEYTDPDYLGPVNYSPNTTAADQIWYRPDNDTWYVSNAARRWFVTPFDELPDTADIPTDDTTYTGGAEFLGQYDTANDAANSIVADAYDATIQYFFFDRADRRVEWLSAYTAPVAQEEYWDITHVLTDENRGTPHPYETGYSATTTLVDTFVDTAIPLPPEGWIYLIGVASGHNFNFRIPVNYITAKTASAGGTAVSGSDDALTYTIGDMDTDLVHFGYDSSRNLLIAGGDTTAVSVDAFV